MPGDAKLASQSFRLSKGCLRLSPEVGTRAVRWPPQSSSLTSVGSSCLSLCMLPGCQNAGSRASSVLDWNGKETYIRSAGCLEREWDFSAAPKSPRSP